VYTDDEEEEKIEVGSFVAVNYNEDLYPGEVTKMDKNNAVVSCLQKSIFDLWRWPQQPDTLQYSFADMYKIGKPTLVKNSNSRAKYYRVTF